MSRIAQETIDQIKNYHDIVTIINHYVPLRRRGRNHIGLCPFHGERTPSFTVSPEKKIFHCFGCHESGDLIAFISKIDNLSFSESIEQIANLAGIDVQMEEVSKYDSQYDIDRKAVVELLSFLNTTFQTSLNENKGCLDYISKRNVTDESKSKFNIGFASSAINLQVLLENQGSNSHLIKKTGVFYETDQGNLISRFKERLIFPIQDYQGRTVGFGGRILTTDKKIAKYINSEESILFNKRKLLYGLNLAKKEIKKKGFVILVEGYMDVILAHQYGFENTVASMGTALTMDQVLLLKRLTDTVYLAMDSDDAGQQAIERSYEVLQQYQMKTKIINMEEKDPADVLVEHGDVYFQSLIDNAQPMIEFFYKRLTSKFDMTDINQVSSIVNALTFNLKNEKDLVIRNYYIKLFSQKLGVDSDIFYARIKDKYFNISKRLDLKTSNKKSKVLKAQEFIIYVLVSKLDLRQEIRSQINSNDFTTPEFQKLYELIIDSALSDSSLISSIEDKSSKSLLSKIVLETEQCRSDQIEQELIDCIATIKESLTAVRIQTIKDKLKELDSSGVEDEVTALLLELQELKKGDVNDNSI
jgi:DNA primase